MKSFRQLGQSVHEKWAMSFTILLPLMCAMTNICVIIAVSHGYGSLAYLARFSINQLPHICTRKGSTLTFGVVVKLRKQDDFQ